MTLTVGRRADLDRGESQPNPGQQRTASGLRMQCRQEEYRRQDADLAGIECRQRGIGDG